MRCSTRAFLALSILAAAACAPPVKDAVRTGPALPGQSASVEATSRRSRNRITTDELNELRSRGASDLLTLIQRARPTWLRSRREDSSPVDPMILYNDRRINGPAELRTMPSSVVESLEYINPPASLGRYGDDGRYGVIIIRGG
jgi:hypothetical protein